MQIKPVALNEVWAMRQAVMYPNEPLSFVQLPDDDHGEHLGLYLDDELVAIEAAGHGVHSGLSAATTALGKPGVLHGSKSLVMQTEDGQVVEPHSISAGLDYPGIGPLHAHLFDSGRGTFLSATDAEALQAAFNLAKKEGIIPALESAHALAALEVLTANKPGTVQIPEKARIKKDSVVVLCLSGRGDKDMATYMKAMENK